MNNSKCFNDLKIGDTVFYLYYGWISQKWSLDKITITNIAFRKKSISFEYKYQQWSEYFSVPKDKMNTDLILQNSSITSYRYNWYISPNLNRIKPYLTDIKEDITDCLDTIYKYENF